MEEENLAPQEAPAEAPSTCPGAAQLLPSPWRAVLPRQAFSRSRC